MRTFERLGWSVQRQKGSHAVLKRKGSPMLVIPNTTRDLKTGIQAAILKTSGLELQEIREAL